MAPFYWPAGDSIKTIDPTSTFEKYLPPFQPLYTTPFGEFTFCPPEDSAHFSSIWRTLSPCLGLSKC